MSLEQCDLEKKKILRRFVFSFFKLTNRIKDFLQRKIQQQQQQKKTKSKQHIQTHKFKYEWNWQKLGDACQLRKDLKILLIWVILYESCFFYLSRHINLHQQSLLNLHKRWAWCVSSLSHTVCVLYNIKFII